MRIKESGDLCGVASIAMLLQWCGITASFNDIYRGLLISDAYVKGTGTYLQYAVKLYPHKLHYLRYMPTTLMRLLLANRYCIVASVNEDAGSGGHIVFICGGDKQMIYYYDPNKNEEQKSMSYKEWSRKSNKRAIIMKAHS